MITKSYEIIEHYNNVRDVWTHHLLIPGELSAWAYPQILSYRLPNPESTSTILSVTKLVTIVSNQRFLVHNSYLCQ